MYFSELYAATVSMMEELQKVVDGCSMAGKIAEITDAAYTFVAGRVTGDPGYNVGSRVTENFICAIDC